MSAEQPGGAARTTLAGGPEQERTGRFAGARSLVPRVARRAREGRAQPIAPALDARVGRSRHLPRRVRRVRRVWRVLSCAVLLSSVAMAAGALTVGRSHAAPPPAWTARRAAAVSVDDGAPSIYGLSGTFAAPCPQALCNGAISVPRVAQTGSAYLRLSLNLACPGSPPAAPAPIRGNAGTTGALLSAAAQTKVIPIVNVVPRGDCPDGIPPAPADWFEQLRSFVTLLHANGWYPPGRWIYFEIGNEPNLTPIRYGSSYAADFRAAAQGVQAAMGRATRYRVLTAGMAQPTALPGGACLTGLPYAHARPRYTNLQLATDAIAAAEQGPDPVAPAHLGVSVHPYRYNTREVATFWRNYYYWGNTYAGECFDLFNLIQTWTAQFAGLPLFFTEANWSDQPLAAIHCTNINACEGTYLVDLFTWLHDKGYDNPRSSPLRVTFFRGADADLSLGLLGGLGNDKPFWTGYCPLDPSVAGWKALASVYAALLKLPCY